MIGRRAVWVALQVSATAFNEGSSRSHTIMRLSVESSERPGPDADPRIHVARTLSFLNLIDLAGSESAKVCCFLASVATLHPAVLPHANANAMYLSAIQCGSLLTTKGCWCCVQNAPQ